jgi:hypothetical protein
LQAVGQTIGATLLPFMSQLARDAATVTTPLQSLSGSGAHTAAVLGDVAGSVTSLIPGGTVAGAAINFLSGQVDSAATSADKANAKMKALKDAAQNLQQGFDASGRSAAGFVGDMSSAEVQASLSAAAQKDLADSVAKTAEVQKEQADASKALADGAKLASEWVKTLNDAEQAQFDTTRQLLGLEVEVPKKLEEVATAASDADKAFAAASKSGGKNADLNQKAADSYLALKDKILSTSDSLQKQSDQLDKSKGKTDTAYQSTLHYAEGLLTSAGSSKTAQLAALGFEQQLKDIPKDTQARVSTLVNEGRLPEAVALLQQVEGTHYSQAILSVAVIGDINTFRTITAQVGGGLSVTAKRFKASGGPVSGGTAYVVGEKGPEMFVPSTAGTIIPNGGGIGGGSVTINIGSVQANNPGELIYALEKFVQNNGKARLQRLVGV